MAEGMAPSAVNDGVRALMASVAKYRDDQAGTLTTGGSSTAYTVTTNQVFASLSAMSGQSIRVKFNATNGASPTLNVDGLGAKAIVTVTGTAVATGALIANNIYELVYSNSSSEWILVAGTTIGAQFDVGTLMLFQQTSAPSGWTKQTTHNDKALRVVSGTASSGGTTSFSSTFTTVTIARNQLPNVDFISDSTLTMTVGGGTFGGQNSGNLGSSGQSAPINTAGITVTPSGHIYLNGNVTQQTLPFAVQYVDLIIASKN